MQGFLLQEFLKAGSLGEDFNRIFISFSRCAFPEEVISLPIWFCCFSGPGVRIQLRPRCYLQGSDFLYLAVLSSLPHFPHSTCQGIFLTSYYSALPLCLHIENSKEFTKNNY